MEALRESAYPIPQTHHQKAETNDDKSLQVDARTAAATEGAVKMALAQLALGVLGIGGVGLTVFYAHKAWKEAERSASAAHDTLQDARDDAAAQAARFEAQIAVASAQATAAAKHAQIAEDTASKQLRAYVSAEWAEMNWATEGYPLFTVSLKNSGMTPAINVRCSAIYRIVPLLSAPRDPTEKYELTREDIIGGNATLKTTLYVHGYEDIRGPLSQDRTLFLFGRVEYEDILGKAYETEFSFYAAADQPFEKRLSVNTGNRAAFRERKREA